MPTYIDYIVVEGGYPTQDGYIRVLPKPNMGKKRAWKRKT